MPPLLTEEEINQILNIQPAPKFLFKEVISLCSTTELCTEAFSHEKTIEQVDSNVVLCSQEDLFPENAPTHQSDGIQT